MSLGPRIILEDTGALWLVGWARKKYAQLKKLTGMVNRRFEFPGGETVWMKGGPGGGKIMLDKAGGEWWAAWCYVESGMFSEYADLTLSLEVCRKKSPFYWVNSLWSRRYSFYEEHQPSPLSIDWKDLGGGRALLTVIPYTSEVMPALVAEVVEARYYIHDKKTPSALYRVKWDQNAMTRIDGPKSTELGYPVEAQPQSIGYLPNTLILIGVQGAVTFQIGVNGSQVRVYTVVIPPTSELTNCVTSTDEFGRGVLDTSLYTTLDSSYEVPGFITADTNFALRVGEMGRLPDDPAGTGDARYRVLFSYAKFREHYDCELGFFTVDGEGSIANQADVVPRIFDVSYEGTYEPPATPEAEDALKRVVFPAPVANCIYAYAYHPGDETVRVFCASVEPSVVFGEEGVYPDPPTYDVYKHIFPTITYSFSLTGEYLTYTAQGQMTPLIDQQFHYNEREPDITFVEPPEADRVTFGATGNAYPASYGGAGAPRIYCGNECLAAIGIRGYASSATTGEPTPGEEEAPYYFRQLFCCARSFDMGETWEYTEFTPPTGMDTPLALDPYIAMNMFMIAPFTADTAGSQGVIALVFENIRESVKIGANTYPGRFAVLISTDVGRTWERSEAMELEDVEVFQFGQASGTGWAFIKTRSSYGLPIAINDFHYYNPGKPWPKCSLPF